MSDAEVRAAERVIARHQPRPYWGTEPILPEGRVVEEDGSYIFKLDLSKILGKHVEMSFNVDRLHSSGNPRDAEWLCRVLARQIGDLAHQAKLAGMNEVRSGVKRALGM